MRSGRLSNGSFQVGVGHPPPPASVSHHYSGGRQEGKKNIKHLQYDGIISTNDTSLLLMALGRLLDVPFGQAYGIGVLQPPPQQVHLTNTIV